jgi:hypothetical protein
MKKAELEDDLKAEYDLKSLKVRKLGSGRKSFGGSIVRLETDVAEIFSSAEAVNEALRFLIKVMQKNHLPALTVSINNGMEQSEKEL